MLHPNMVQGVKMIPGTVDQLKFNTQINSCVGVDDGLKPKIGLYIIPAIEGCAFYDCRLSIFNHSCLAI